MADDDARERESSTIHLTRIYTRTGDDGTTALGDMSRVAKTDVRLAAYADVDEANSAIGVAVALGSPSAHISDLLRSIQNDLFDVGADLCVPGEAGERLRLGCVGLRFRPASPRRHFDYILLFYLYSLFPYIRF